MPLSTGTRLGPYEIVAPIGAGGMGEVYKARDTRLDRLVAIKVLPSHLADNPELRQRFEREARTISSLNHPHICTLYDIGHQDGIDFLVMEYLEGETLAQRLAKGSLPTDQVLRYGIQTASALDKAHRQGVTHRDLKPANIMLTKDGVKVLDFGLAKFRRVDPVATIASGTGQTTEDGKLPGEDRKLTLEGRILGTFQYMAPEQLEGQEADARSDIFAFGAVLYEMMTGRPAFAGGSRASLIASILTSEPPAISTLQPLAPPALGRLVKGCLAKDPDKRWQTAHDILLQLEWIAEAGSQAGVPAPVAVRRRKWERASVAATALALLAAILLGIAYYRSSRTEVRAVRASILPPEKFAFMYGGANFGPVVVSPDGRRVAFVARAPDGKSMLWVRALDSLAAQPLAGTEGAIFPFWAPDSRFLGFFAAGKLKKIEVTGGPPQALCDAPVGLGGSWNREGIIIFSPNLATGLHRVSAGGGAATPVTQFGKSRQETGHRWPQFLPDGRHFLYFVRAAIPENTGMYVASLDSGEPKLILRTDSNALYAPPGYLLFVRDRTLMAQPFGAKRLRLTGDPFPVAEQVAVNAAVARGIFTVSDNGVLAYQAGAVESGWKLVWFDRSGKEGSALGEAATYYWPCISPEGDRVAVGITDAATGNHDIWVLNLSRGVKTRLTFHAANETSPVWSSDGNRIAFWSNRKGLFHIYQKASSGVGAEETLLETDADERASSWSSDGRYIAYYRLDAKAKTGFDIWVLPLSGDRKPFPFLQSEFEERHPEFSPDGRWIAYASNESGRQEIYIAPFPGAGGKWQVSTAGGAYPRWRRDGKELFFIAADNKLMTAEINQKGESLEIGAVRPLFQARPAPALGSPYDVTADGKRFLVSTASEQAASEPLTLVINWTAQLKR